MATANTTPEIQAQIDAIKQQIAALTSITMPEVVIAQPTNAGGGYLPNPTQADIVSQINASFAITANAVQTYATALANTVSHLLENPTLVGNTTTGNVTSNGNLSVLGNTTVNGHITPLANVSYDLGTATMRWRNIYTGDLQLSNGIGDYTIVEGESDLFIYNNNTNKTYKFALIEVDPSTVPAKSKAD